MILHAIYQHLSDNDIPAKMQGCPGTAAIVCGPIFIAQSGNQIVIDRKYITSAGTNWLRITTIYISDPELLTKIRLLLT